MSARALLPGVALALAGCVTAASTAYQTATDERSVATQADDTAIAVKIKKGLLDSGVKTLLALDVHCQQGLVVLAGVVEPGSKIGGQGVAIARGVAGVRRVETYFLPGQPSKTSDFGISVKLKARIVGDGDLKAPQLDWSVIAGHVVLVGVVDRQAKIDAVVRHARAIDGVQAVRSFIQLKSP